MNFISEIENMFNIQDVYLSRTMTHLSLLSQFGQSARCWSNSKSLWNKSLLAWCNNVNVLKFNTHIKGYDGFCGFVCVCVCVCTMAMIDYHLYIYHVFGSSKNSQYHGIYIYIQNSTVLVLCPKTWYYLYHIQNIKHSSDMVSRQKKKKNVVIQWYALVLF